MAIKRVLVCEAQVPFVHGGAEYYVRTLVAKLREHGCEAELVSIPFKWYPKEELLAQAAAWRLIDLSEANGRPIDLVIGSKFPTYCVRHPNKVTWLLHQHRAAYDLCGTKYSDFEHVEADVGLRETLLRLDRSALQECRRVFTISRNTAERLQKFNGLRADPLYPPPPIAGRLEAGPYGEDDVPNPRGVYARTKRCSEEAALLLAPDCAVARVAVVYSGRPGAKSTFATQVVEKLSRGEPVKAFHDQLVSPTLAENGAAMALELLLETSYRGVLHTCGATVLDRVDFARRVAARFGLSGEIVPVRTGDVNLLAPRPLRAGLRVDRAATLLREKPLAIDAALDMFHCQWIERSAA